MQPIIDHFDLTMTVHIFTSASPLTLRLLKVLSCILLLLPSCFSAVLYFNEKDAPSYPFFISTVLFLMSMSLFFAMVTVTFSLALPCRLVEPFAIYLTALANSCQHSCYSALYIIKTRLPPHSARPKLTEAHQSPAGVGVVRPHCVHPVSCPCGLEPPRRSHDGVE